MERAILPFKLTVEYCTACAQYPEVIAFNLGSSALDIEVEGVCVLSDICRSIHGDVESQVCFGTTICAAKGMQDSPCKDLQHNGRTNLAIAKLYACFCLTFQDLAN